MADVGEAHLSILPARLHPGRQPEKLRPCPEPPSIPGPQSLPQPLHTPPAPRRWFVTTLVVIASVFAFLGIFASWVDQQVFDTDEWTETSTELLKDDEIRGALSVYLADQLFNNVDVAAELQRALPPQTQALAGPVAGAIREVAPRAANRALESAPVQDAWAAANERVHKRLIDVIEDRGDAVSTAGGNVTLDLRALLENLNSRIGIGGRLAERIPPDAGQLVIMKSDQLSFAQDVAKLINGLAVVILPLWLALCALAIYLSPGRRRETLRAAALGFVFAGLLVLIVRKFGGDAVVDSLAQTTSVEPAVESVWSIGTSLLVEIAQSVIVVGVLILIGAWLAGRTRYAVAARRAMAPYIREQPVSPTGS